MKLFFLNIAFFCSWIGFGQTINITVLNEENQTIPFASCYVQEFDAMYIADSTGRVKLKDVPPANYHFDFNAYGFDKGHLDIRIKNDTSFQFVLFENHRELDELIITHTGELQRENITNVAHLKINEVNQIATTTIGQALTQIPGVYETGIGTGISKPVIRGLSGSRVVTYINSLRIENQQWGGDHGLPITSLGVGGVEVIKGPASLLFGADALGGVLYFVDEPYAKSNSTELSFKSQFESNTLGTVNELGYKINKNKIRLNAFFGYDNHADYQLSNGKYVQNSRFHQYSGKLALGYNTEKWLVNVRYNFYRGLLGLPGHTHDSIINPESFQRDEQSRAHTIPQQVATNHFLSVENKFFFEKGELVVGLGNTNNHLEEFEEKIFTPAININLNNTLLNAKLKYQLSKRTKLVVGTQEMLQFNKNAPGAEELIIPDAQTLDYGAFALLMSSIKKWKIQGGARIDNRTIETRGSEFYNSYTGYNFAFGLARIRPKSTTRFNVSSGFRAPTSAELLSDGVHHGAFRYERGNQGLKTEKGLQVDLSYAVHFSDLELIINPFYHRVYDYIYLQKSSDLVGSYQVFDYVQTDFAQLYGVDFGFHYHPHRAHWMHIETNFSTIFAEDEFKNALPLIPQSRINNQIRADLKAPRFFKKLNLIVQYNYSFLQDRVGILETPTNDYHLVNFGANAKLKGENPIIIGIGVNNLLNQEYTNHLSGLKNIGLANPGRNVYLSFKYQFAKPLKSK
ncbi:TonB-dependent receptor plug domain-containing protein [Crocinitomix algicola]|uniref:TonB-dependent receptor plug domain-containing protein n=1 Tax=Crocinitomix algicola TaxID=1740263 RepID=UPI0008727840|nr:TonB-dependent receptor [Crocinitomix algicola]